MIGWIALAVIVVAFTLALVKQRMKKANKAPSHYVVLVDGFPTTHVPREAVPTMQEARAVVVMLKEAYRASWAVLEGIYDKPMREAPIDTIGMSLGPVHKDHPEVVWFAPTSKMRLRFQPSMYYHFAGELHNMFRFNLHGIEYIYKMKNTADRMRAMEARAWIRENYYE